MQDETSEEEPGSAPSALHLESHGYGGHEVPTKRSRTPREDWRLGGRARNRWDGSVFVVAVLAVTAASLFSLAVSHAAPSLGGHLAAPILWMGFFAASAFALARARPPGLFRFRTQDLIWGATLSSILLLTRASLGGTNHLPFPTSHLVGDLPGASWLVLEAIPLGLVGPVTEELVFRGVLLVSAYQCLRPFIGSVGAALTAALFSSGSFIIVHAIFGEFNLVEALRLLLLGVSCAALVLMTGRIWGAVVTHILHNGTYLLLAVVGTLLSR